MNLSKLFETQRVLDERIVKEKGLEGQYLLDEKLRALLTEIGELSNEERSFKFWSEDREPRTKEPATAWGEPYRNPLLEEFVDCLHFFISTAIELKINPDDFVVTCDYTQSTVTGTFNRLFSSVSSIEVLLDPETPASISLDDIQEALHEAFSCFIGLGEKFLGFTWEQIEQAYYAKNKINHERQATGY